MASSVTEAQAEARCSIIYSRLLAQAAWSEVSAVRLCRRSMVVLLVSKLAGYLKAFDGRRLVNLQDAPGRLPGLFRYGIGQRLRMGDHPNPRMASSAGEQPRQRRQKRGMQAGFQLVQSHERRQAIAHQRDEQAKYFNVPADSLCAPNSLRRSRKRIESGTSSPRRRHRARRQEMRPQSLRQDPSRPRGHEQRRKHGGKIPRVGPERRRGDRMTGLPDRRTGICAKVVIGPPLQHMPAHNLQLRIARAIPKTR
jgi:hypothetical protein